MLPSHHVFLVLGDLPRIANVSAVAESPIEILVTWDVETVVGQNITGFEVIYQPQRPFLAPQMVVNVSALEMAVFLTGLEEYVNYTISVQAYTSGGVGPQSGGITILTLEDSKE